MAIKYIYKLINPLNNAPFYVGQTVNLEQRLKKHITNRLCVRYNYPVHKTILYIVSNNAYPLIEVIEEVKYNPKSSISIEKISIRERYWINQLSVQFELSNIENNKFADTGVRECKRCDNVFKPIKPKQIYCSDQCRTYAYRERMAALKSINNNHV